MQKKRSEQTFEDLFKESPVSSAENLFSQGKGLGRVRREESLNIAFYIDGTLIDHKDQPRWDIISVLKTLSKQGHIIIMWSGGGKSYAEMWSRKLFLTDYVNINNCRAKSVKDEEIIDISFDDEEMTLATVNVKVKFK